MKHRLATVFLAAVFVAGCQETRECERARMDLAKTWRGLAEAAHRRQLAGVDIEGWKWVEARLELLESAFTTKQVTWDSADKARGEVVTRLPGLNTDTPANTTGFRLSADAAVKEQDAYTKQCK